MSSEIVGGIDKNIS